MEEQVLKEGSLRAGADESDSGAGVRELYSADGPHAMDTLPARSVQVLAEPAVRTHGAKEISEGALNAGHGVALAVMFVGIVLIAFARGPRKVDALATIWSQKNERR